MSLPGLGPNEPPQGWRQRISSPLSRVTRLFGRRRVYNVSEAQHQSLKPSSTEASTSTPKTRISNRSSEQTPAKTYLPSAFKDTLTGTIYHHMRQASSLEHASNVQLQKCSFDPDSIEEVRSQMEDLTQQLNQLKKALLNEIDLPQKGSTPTKEQDCLASIKTMTEALTDRSTILQSRLNEHPRSNYHLLKSQLGHYEAATKAVIGQLEKTNIPNQKKLEELLTQLQNEQAYINTQMQGASHSAPVDKGSIRKLQKLPKNLVHKLKQHHIKASLDSHKEILAGVANKQPWIVSKRPINFQYKEGYHKFQETVSPASKLQFTRAHLPEAMSLPEKPHQIFKKSYSTEGVSCHSTHETKHAVNLNTSVLTDSQGKEVFHAVRHAVHSPYGLDTDDPKRAEGAFQRAQESAVAALYLHPEKMKEALNAPSDKPVELILTSSSLLTPDVFRHASGNREGDEQAMLRDQVRAWTSLNLEKTLPVNLPNGTVKYVPVKIRVVPFNFGMNKFSLGPTAGVTGGWGYADSINKMGITELTGPIGAGRSAHGGMVGEFFQKNPNHPDTQIIDELVFQIRDIYKHKKHHNTEGGAAKLAARVMVLTHLIGGTPLVNCKSAKDRTALTMADAERLMAQTRLTGSVPSHDSLTSEDRRLFKEFAVQGNHQQIQDVNSGAPGFKVDNPVLDSYLGSKEERVYIQGLSAAVLA